MKWIGCFRCEKFQCDFVEQTHQNVWVQLGPLCCLTKLGAKRAELVQKFVPQSRIGIFATNASYAPHWTLNLCFGVFATNWVHSGPFGCLRKLGAKRAELVQKFVPRSRVGIFRNERTRTTPLDPKLNFLVHFVLSWCHRDCLVALRNSVENGPI